MTSKIESMSAAAFFAHAPGHDGELTLEPGDGWTVLRSVAEEG